MLQQSLAKHEAWVCLVAFGLLCVSRTALAVDEGSPPGKAFIEGYEPNYLGYAWQDDDVGFVDIGISLKYQLIPTHFRNLTCWKKPDGSDNPACRDTFRTYLTFTGRSGFYLRTRNSDPVISKTFNPKLLLRYTPDAPNPKTYRNSLKTVQEYTSYIDLAYAHESNGQTINNSESYRLERRLGEEPEYALDRVSRGWDYVQMVMKRSFLVPDEGQRLASFIDLKWFPSDGLIQGRAEEYHDWERDAEGKRRRAVNGISGVLEWEFRHTFNKRGAPIVSDPRFLLKYETGYDPAFKYDTFRVEVGATFFELPIALWYQDGYNHSLAQYYKRTGAFGIELRISE